MDQKKKKTPEFWRYAAFLVVLFAIFVWLSSGLMNLQLKQSEEYKEKAEETAVLWYYISQENTGIPAGKEQQDDGLPCHDQRD